MDHEEKIARYNKALAQGNDELAKVYADELLRDIHEKIMEEDQYQERTHGV